MKNRKAQEEIVGFAIILILVGVILLIFLALSITKPQKKPVESFEAGDFLQSAFQVSTPCEINFEPNRSVKQLIFYCEGSQICLKGETACEILNSTLSNILKEAFVVGNESSKKGYLLNISDGLGRSVLDLEAGNITTGTFKSSVREGSRGGNSFVAKFSIYFS